MDRFGVHSLAELREELTEQQIAELIAADRLIRIERGWYGAAAAKSDAVSAIKLGGRVGCLSGCRLHGLWAPPEATLHVLLNPGRAIPAHQPGVQFHRAAHPCGSAVTPLEDCLAQVLQRHDPEMGLVVLESAVNLGHTSIGDAQALISAAPARKQRGLHHFMPGAQSGSETRLRLFFQRLNVSVEPQALIPGVGHVDLLVGRSWIVEADSEAHHGSRTDQEVDRHRDLSACELGYYFTRLTYQQIWMTWERTSRILTQRLRTRHHLKPPRSI